MKVRAALLILATIGSVCAQSDHPPREGTEKDVQVGRLSKAIPNAQEDADQYIWDTFSKRTETKLFLRYSTKDWRKNYDRFSTALVEKAKDQGFEWESLRSCLEKLTKEAVAQGGRLEVAYLPIGAYRTSRNLQQVWVVFCLWEDAMDPSDQVRDFPPPLQDSETTINSKPSTPPLPMGWPTVGHIRMFTFDVSNATLIGFVTCD